LNSRPSVLRWTIDDAVILTVSRNSCKEKTKISRGLPWKTRIRKKTQVLSAVFSDPRYPRLSAAAWVIVARNSIVDDGMTHPLPRGGTDLFIYHSILFRDSAAQGIGAMR